MSFSSPGFLFAFMPVTFVLYYLLPATARNAFLFAASFAFYLVDAVEASVVLLASVVVNQVIGVALHRLDGRTGAARAVLAFGIVANLLPLLYYKYWGFLVVAAGDVSRTVGGPALAPWAAILLPAGISFFTFQGISYLVDIHRREAPPARSVVDFGMYHTLFPQLIAGPIVRYVEVADRIRDRPVWLEDVHAGLLRFCLGLGKKIIVADSAGVVADRMFSLPADQLGMGEAWLGAVAYTVQILFDFSGYSDMAIGMGRMLGFRFPENFDQPYRARSVTEFWRRWHMTLSRWFRDYVYIPLGGNRAGRARTYLNLVIVFGLCGLWHGAAYTFLAWGLFHGFLLVVERVAKDRAGWTPGGLGGWGGTMLLVMVGWVLFRAPTLDAAVAHLAAMAGLGAGTSTGGASAALTPDKVTFLFLGIAGALLPLGWWRMVGERLGGVARAAMSVGAILVFAYAAILIAANGFNPFIYFRF